MDEIKSDDQKFEETVKRLLQTPPRPKKSDEEKDIGERSNGREDPTP